MEELGQRYTNDLTATITRGVEMMAESSPETNLKRKLINILNWIEHYCSTYRKQLNGVEEMMVGKTSEAKTEKFNSVELQHKAL